MVEGEFRRITALADGIVPLSSHRVRQIEYRGGGGKLLKGALLLPPNLIDGQAYPTVCLVYAGSVLVDAERAFSNGFNPVGSLPRMLADMGYVVLRPSIPLTPTGQKSSPAEEIPAPVLAALDRAIEMGIADPERIGVLGQSYGGYTTQVLITRTTRFKAAVSMAGLSNLISHYGDFDARRRHRAGKSTAPNWAEQGQVRMGVPIWDDPWNYVENSPVFRLEKVETPLLLIHGDLDFVGIQQAEQVFTGLDRLGKTVELARYFGEGHVFSKPANIRDSWQRIVAWFDQHLTK